ncbi:MAG: hypothetical protein EHM72_19380 [Calditrichaeota bacterium]|nr:MAG: hypothetical protein EHM72_19380 [Calditrichota bacterium]
MKHAGIFMILLLFYFAGSAAAKAEANQVVVNDDSTLIGLNCRDLKQPSETMDVTENLKHIPGLNEMGVFLQTCPILPSKFITNVGEQIDPEFTKLMGTMMDPKMVYPVDPAIDLKIFPKTMRPFRTCTKSPK